MSKEKLANPVITLTSDFGDRFAQAQIELVINDINPKAKFVVISNEVTSFSILEGAFLLAKSYKLSPRDSIHIAVVDPGVGSDRRGLLIRSKNYWFVGPDNGLLYPAASDDRIEEAFALNEQLFNTGGLATFHGRDIFAPAAARISKGESPLKFAEYIEPESIKKFGFEKDQVAHIDYFGNAKLTSLPDHFQIGDQLEIDLTTGRVIIPFARTFADVPPENFVAYMGSHGTLEIAQRLGSAARVLHLAVGQTLNINVIKALELANS